MLFEDNDLITVFELMGKTVRGQGYQRKVSCPLADWLHPKGEDKSPSCSIKVADPTVFYCFSCHSKGTIKTLAKKYAELSGKPDAYNYVVKLEGGSHYWNRVSKIPYGRRKKIKSTQQGFHIKRLEEFRKSVPQYALDRGLNKKQIIFWDIGFDEKTNRMTIPIRDYRGILAGVSGRDVTGAQEPKYKHYYGLKKELVFYGEQALDKKIKRGYIVEGFFDVWGLERIGVKNVMASMGTSLSLEQRTKLREWFHEVVFLPDLDDAGAGLGFCQKAMLEVSRLGVKTGIAAVRNNPEYKPRLLPRVWENQDYQYLGLDEYLGKDPADWGVDLFKKAIDGIIWLES